MTQQTFQTIRQAVANQSQTRQPMTGFYVSTTAFGSNAASTDIVRMPSRAANR